MGKKHFSWNEVNKKERMAMRERLKRQIIELRFGIVNFCIGTATHGVRAPRNKSNGIADC